MLTECNPEPMLFARLDRREVVADFGGGAMTSDAGALLLGAVAVRGPERRTVPAHQIAHHLRAAAESGLVQHDARSAEHPMLGIDALDPHAGFIAGDGPGLAQLLEDHGLLGIERRLGPLQHIAEPALADLQTEHVGKQPFQPLIGNVLQVLQVQRQCPNIRPERRALRQRRGFGLVTALSAGADQPLMPGDNRSDRRQVERFILGDDTAQHTGGERLTAVAASSGAMRDGLVRMLGEGSEMAFVTRLGPTGLGCRALGLAVGRRRLRGRPRRLRRALKLQHQLHQLVLAELLEVIAIHSKRESRFATRRKGVGSYLSRNRGRMLNIKIQRNDKFIPCP